MEKDNINICVCLTKSSQTDNKLIFDESDSNHVFFIVAITDWIVVSPVS